MTAKEIIKNVCVFLGKEELLDCNLFNSNGSLPTEAQIKEINKMLKCLNLIIDEIASNYIPLIKQKIVEFHDAKADIYDIDTNIQEIISVKSFAGNSLRYRYIGDLIVCLVSKAIVTYKVYPEELDSLTDIVETFGNRLSARVLAYGVASEFCNLEMLYDDATIWENRFKNALLFSSRKKGEVKLKQRGWY